ncbi:MAG TPA: TrkH family potassium uptake protein [Trueperaceae bacterium]
MQSEPQGPVENRRRARRALQPARVIAIAFLSAIVIGALLLLLPISTTSEAQLDPLGALFTATSAVCVTGLIVIDTGSGFTRFGQVVILALIQIGGLGVLSLGSVLAFVVRRRISFRERLRLRAELNALQVGGVVRLLRGVLLFTFAFELIGTLLLWIRFWPLYGWSEGLYYAAFHAVSAFNNAGFALYPDSLIRFANDPFLLLTIAALFIIGGLGFLVFVNYAFYLAGLSSRLTLHARIVLLTSGALLLLGTILILLFEWNNSATLGTFSPAAKFVNAFFQAATPRTAGFNSLDYASMTEVSLFFTILLMFVGASPASTGGGIKTVTAFVVLLSAISEVRGKNELEVFGRRVPSNIVLKAGTVALFSFLFIAGALLVLALTDPGLRFLDVAFEAFSAFGTVGLSTGITAQLSDLGKLAIILLMYVGRLGPTTFALALVTQEREDRVRYPAEEVIIG